MPQLTVNGLWKLLQKEEGWVRWFAVGVYNAVNSRGKVVSIVGWCLQSPNADQRSAVEHGGGGAADSETRTCSPYFADYWVGVGLRKRSASL